VTFPNEARLLRVFVGADDRRDGRPTYERILERARECGLAGATAVRGVAGFGAHSRVHTAKILRLSEDLPVMIEIIDAPDKVAAFVEELDGLVDEGLVTVEPVQVALYRTGKSAD
jgi:PII-like signaling protein